MIPADTPMDPKPLLGIYTTPDKIMVDGKPDNAKGKPWDLTGVALAVESLIQSFSLLTWC